VFWMQGRLAAGTQYRGVRKSGNERVGGTVEEEESSLSGIESSP
jgi:hypothetical protein